MNAEDRQTIRARAEMRYSQEAADVLALLDALEAAETRVAFLVAEAHDWQPRLAAAEAALAAATKERP
jgi:hypothetical protein